MKVNIAMALAVLVALAVLIVAYIAFMEMLTNLLDLAERIVEN